MFVAKKPKGDINSDITAACVVGFLAKEENTFVAVKGRSGSCMEGVHCTTSVGIFIQVFCLLRVHVAVLTMTSPVQIAKRAFVKLLLTLSATYSIVLDLNRDSTDDDVSRAFRSIVKRCHPDKGGNAQDTQRLNHAEDEWEQAKGRKGQPGRPQKEPRGAGGRQGQQPTGKGARQANGDNEGPRELADPDEARRTFRIQALGCMLTFNGIRDLEQWRRFVTFAAAKQKTWGVQYWCATLERCEASGHLHIHLHVQFHSAKDRTSHPFAFEGIRPRADPKDLLGEGLGRRNAQVSMNRGFFYVWADKVGTMRDEAGAISVAGNYFPCWTKERRKCEVPGRWPEKPWEARKLSDEVYEEYLFLCRDGVIGRKRNLDACRERERVTAEEGEIAARAKRIHGNASLYVPFPRVPTAETWLKVFQNDALRCPILVAHGPSFTGKTEWAKSLFTNALEAKIGNFGHFPEKFRQFDKRKHDGIVLDDIRDLQWVADHQDKLQGTYSGAIEFVFTPGGGHAYFRDLFRVPIVITTNLSTVNLEFFQERDWLGHPGNRVIVWFPLPGLAPP